jgi:hypothetical protein
MFLTVSGLCRPLWSVAYSAKASSKVLRLHGNDYGAAKLLRATAVSSYAFRPILLSGALVLSPSGTH